MYDVSTPFIRLQFGRAPSQLLTLIRRIEFQTQGRNKLGLEAFPVNYNNISTGICKQRG